MLMFVRIVFALALAALPGTASCARADARPPAATILVFGDSLSAGYGLPQGTGWASLLEKRLRDDGFTYRVVNASVSGETTSGGLRRIDGALKTHRPQIVVIELGANDGLRGSSVDLMRRNLEAMIDASRRAKTEVLLVGMRLPPNYGMTYTEKFRQTYADVARSKKTALVPFLFEGFAEEARYFQADRVHPTGEAQGLMLESVWKGLKPLLRK
jgi:acyl-CoA thioesterase-1